MSAAIKFYTDTHIAKAVAVQLRARGVDVVRCEEVGLAEADDLEHLDYATREGRVVITHDNDFLRLDKQWRTQGRTHAGVMYCLQHLQGSSGIGRIVSECIHLHELSIGGAVTFAGDIKNSIIFVS